MNPYLRYGILLIFILGMSVALIESGASPLIYTPEKGSFPSSFHNNTGVLRQQSLNSTTDVLPLMQDLLDYSGPIILNVRIQDIDQARRDLEKFSKNRVAFSNLIVNLDMTESEMQEYSKNVALQEKILHELVNSSESLERLKTLEVQYRNDNDPTRLISVRLEGDALRQKIHDLYIPYETQTRDNVEFSKKKGLDTATAEQSLDQFQRYLQEVDAGETPVILPPGWINRLTLLVIPERASYGDTIDCSGYLLSQYGNTTPGVPRHNLTIFIDDTPFSSAVTDSSGHYSVQFPLERISSGVHPIRADSGTNISETRTLTVIPVDSVTSLAVGSVNNTGGVTLSGTIIARRPVRLAPVQLVWDGTNTVETTTDTEGRFKTVLLLPPGKHTVIARFTGTGYPINPSESKSSEVEISILQSGLPVDFSRLFLPIIIVAVIAVFLGGAFFYIRRSRHTGRYQSHIPGETFGSIADDDDHHDVLTPDLSHTPVSEETDRSSESLFFRYLRVCEGSGLSEAAHTVYREFSRYIAQDLHVSCHTSLTPHELSGGCRQKPYCRAFSRFVAVYERIRYGGYHSLAVQKKFEKALKTTESSLGREDH